MKKKVFLVLVAIMAIWQNTFAYDFSAVAPSGQTLYYNINGSRVSVTYPGSSTTSTWDCCTKPSGQLIIPETVVFNGITYTVTSIGNWSFAYCTNITSVELPNSITSIENYAFACCSSLHYVQFPDTLTSIGVEAFASCTTLSNVIIPNSVIYIGRAAFDHCIGLTHVIIPNNVTSISEFTFYNCTSLTSVTIGNLVDSIGVYAFANCFILNNITSFTAIAPTVTSSSFNGVPNAATVSIPCGSQMSYYSGWSYFSNFVEELGYTFNATSSDSTRGYVTILTPPTCQNPLVVFNAIANDGYSFSYWSDGNTDNPRTLTLISDTSITAIFEAIPTPFNVVANNALGGGSYLPGSTATIAALPQVDLQFAGWSDGETANPRNIVVTSDTTLTALYRAPDTVRVYDTTTIYDTVINMVYDTTEYNHYYYDTTHIYDTLVVFDTTRVFDTMVFVNIDTLHHYYYDTTRVFDTLVIFDTTRVFDTLVYVNTDTLRHYYYDTTRIFDTMVYVNIDTLNHYYYDTTHIYDTLVVFDTTRVFDTVVYVNIDTLHHYYFDTTRVYDTMVYVNVDTLQHYYYDTTRVYETILSLDTVFHYYYDTTHTVDTLVFYDTTAVTHYVFDSTWVFDSVWVFDTVYLSDTVFYFDTVYIEVPVQGVDGVEMVNVKVYTYQTRITVEGAQSMMVRLYDVDGRLLATSNDDRQIKHFYVQTSGTYLVRIGDHIAKKVVVIR